MAAMQTTEQPLALRLAAGDELAKALRQGKLGDFEADSDYAACMMPFLLALGWRGDVREITEALPHFANTLDLHDFRNVLARLNYKTRRISVRGRVPDDRLFPILFIDLDGRANILLRREEDKITLFEGRTHREKTMDIADLKGIGYIVATEEETSRQKARDKDHWVGSTVRRFRRIFSQLLAMSFVLNLIALSVPLLIMTIYDQVIPSQSLSILGYLMLGVTVAFGIEAGLRMVRSKMIAYLGGRLENIIANATFGQILSLPVSLTESAPIGSQVARVKEFDSIRELFTGPLVSVVLEAPFLLLFIAVIAYLGGPLAIIPVVMMGIFGLIGLVLVPSLKRAVTKSSQTRANRHGFLVETITNMRTIKEAGAEQIWADRYQDFSAEASYAHFRTGQITFLFQTLAQTIMMVAGAATVGWGVIRAIDGLMSIGALIACMALVWRVLAPLHGLFLTLTRIEQIKVSVKQINQLMRMPVEERTSNAGPAKRRFAGALTLSRVSFRYKPDAEPALLGVSLAAKPGQLVAFMGPNGAGKSTLLRLILGLQKPQAGQVSLDGMDIRQINPHELRHAIAYVPQERRLFHGSIAQNLRLANPVASAEDMVEACELAGILDDIQALDEGLETRIGDQNIRQLNSGFLQRLSLARAYLKKAPVMLLDEPAQTLDEEGDAAFIRALTRLKGKSTILMVTHRPSHIRLADEVVVVDSGMVVLNGKPEQVLAQLPGGFL